MLFANDKENLQLNMFLQRLPLESKDCTVELKLECASFLGQTS